MGIVVDPQVNIQPAGSVRSRRLRRPCYRSSLLGQGQLVSLIPLVKVALGSGELIQAGQFVLLGQQTLVAALVSLLIAITYSAADWLLSTE